MRSKSFVDRGQELRTCAAGINCPGDVKAQGS